MRSESNVFMSSAGPLQTLILQHAISISASGSDFGWPSLVASAALQDSGTILGGVVAETERMAQREQGLLSGTQLEGQAKADES